MPEDHEAAETFARLAVELHDADGVEETVEAVVQFALDAVGCSYAAVALVSGGRPEVLASTDPKIAELYQMQIDMDEGPMLTAVRQGRAVTVRDAATESRWSSRWADRVQAAGIRSVVHIPLIAANRPAAVLSLYSDRPAAFTPDDVAVAHILARHAAVAIAFARREANLAAEVDARKLVGQAMGILMERHDLTSDQAFNVLRRYSQDTNRKLRDVAQQLIATRKLRH